MKKLIVATVIALGITAVAPTADAHWRRPAHPSVIVDICTDHTGTVRLTVTETDPESFYPPTIVGEPVMWSYWAIYGDGASIADKVDIGTRRTVPVFVPVWINDDFAWTTDRPPTKWELTRDRCRA